MGEVMWPREEGVLGGVPSVHDDVMVAPVGVIIGGVGSELRDAAALLLKEAGVHGVVLLDHGVRDLEVIERAVRGSGWREGGEPVRLFACETGDGALDRLAVGLQERLGVAVGYPIELVWLEVEGPGPAARVGKLGLTENGMPVPVLFDAAGGGGWVRRVPDRRYPDGRIEGWPYTVPAPEGGLGLDQPRHLAPGDTDPVSAGPGTEGQGVTGAGPSDALPADVEWGVGPGQDATLAGYLKKNNRSSPATSTDLQYWIQDLQNAAVTVTGLRVPAPVVAVLSDGQITAKQVRGRRDSRATLAPTPERVRSLVPPWVKAFRPGEVQWYEGELREGEWHEGEWRQ
ncbi:hypothetical protein, partial [Amycolatopsis speibonae]